MTVPTPPAVSDAMREAAASRICQAIAINLDVRVPGRLRNFIRQAIASEIARLTGERDAAREQRDERNHELGAQFVRTLAAEAETDRLRAALKLAENPLSYRHATDPNGPGSHAVARALEAVRAALSSQEQADV